MNYLRSCISFLLLLQVLYFATAELSFKSIKVGISNRLNDIVNKESLVFPKTLNEITSLASDQKLIVEFEVLSSLASNDNPFVLNQSILYITSADKEFQLPIVAKFLPSKNKYKAVLVSWFYFCA
ncbi:hypothetical protein BB561_005987 [Smittium simulii]|uniref:Dolichyl-diphosphooligosaccharide--protein glycosyltransferase subunit 1 n=1 Tax=Smittium simulii TaxID=133385 RepID=A0A2T9Y743_9FUNG|nr:hypothetical protein BB561_005987 [Smittium simulii]